MPWRAPEPGAVPTLGFAVIDWITNFLAAPDKTEYEPFILYPEQERFVLRFYEIDPRSGRRKFRRGVLSRPRGWGKSPFAASLAIVEGLAPVVPDGWDADGQPVGKPWCTVRTPLIQAAAVSEDQTRNVWDALLEMLEGPALYDEYPGLEPLGTFVNLPSGKISRVTSSAHTVKGNRAVFAVLDQTEVWQQGNGGTRLAETMRINAAKVGGSTLETPNAYTPGEGSVAENSAAFWANIRAGKAMDEGLFFDHREAPAETDLTERGSLTAGLRVAYGDSADTAGGHVDLDVIVATVWDPDIDPQRSRADFLNQITHAQDSFLSRPEWASRADSKKVSNGDTVTLGFDGSRGRVKGKPDATALIGCRVEDGHLFQIGVWEAPDGPGQELWSPPIPEIEAALADAFRRYRVAGFYADPAKDWRSHVNAWEAQYSAKVKVRVSVDHPFEWWMSGGRSGMNQRAIESFESAVKHGDMTHDNSFRLTQHVLSARRRIAHSKLTLAKSHDYSPLKIDACVAAVLAWQARLDAVSKGVGRKTTKTISRVR